MSVPDSSRLERLSGMLKRRGIILPAFEIHGGSKGLYDFGPVGGRLRNRVNQNWIEHWTSMGNITEISCPTVTPYEVLEASGHVGEFSDFMADCNSCGEASRADTLLEGVHSNPDSLSKSDLQKLFSRHNPECPSCGARDWSEITAQNLMFNTVIGAGNSGRQGFLRPETAQGIFVNFLNIQKTGRMKLPFGIAQTGKAFRNEIVARQFIFRMREFEQMEMQFFIPPGTQKEWYDKWKNNRLKWHLALDMGKEKYRFHDHEKLAHYADAATDIEFRFPFGFKELEGIHSRTDFDLSNHEKYTGKKLQYFDPEQNKNYIPYVVETSIGLDRMFLAVFSNSLSEEIIEGGTSRIVLKLPPALAPIKVAILPLVKKDGLPELAHKISRNLKWDLTTAYDEKDAVGRRYRRQDALGTPYCVTVDHQSLNDKTVTIRERDSMNQERVSIDNLTELIGKKVSVKSLLEKLV